MKRTTRRVPKTLPPAVSDLVAEGGNVLASDDATCSKQTGYVQPPVPPPVVRKKQSGER